MSGEPFGGREREPLAGIGIAAGVERECFFADAFVVGEQMGLGGEEVLDRGFERFVGVYALVDEHPEDDGGSIDGVRPSWEEGVSFGGIAVIGEELEGLVELDRGGSGGGHGMPVVRKSFLWHKTDANSPIPQQKHKTSTINRQGAGRVEDTRSLPAAAR